MPEVTAGDGYRLLENHEELVSGDECKPLGEPHRSWSESGHPLCDRTDQAYGMIYRRKIFVPESGDGYRMLAKDEHLADGDECRQKGNPNAGWIWSERAHEGVVAQSPDFFYRRAYPVLAKAETPEANPLTVGIPLAELMPILKALKEGSNPKVTYNTNQTDKWNLKEIKHHVSEEQRLCIRRVLSSLLNITGFESIEVLEVYIDDCSG